MSDNYAEETKPLFKMLRTEAFRFVIVRYHHFSLVQQLEKDLQSRFPDRPFLKLDARKVDYQSLTQAYFSISRGFFWIENFGDILKESRDTLGRESAQDVVENERRRGITAGLNLRRDKLAKCPIALFVLVPAAANELYARIIMEKMPDLWSFRSMILDLKQERPAVTNIPSWTGANDTFKKVVSEDTTELKRLLALLEESSENEIAYRLTLYPQIVREAMNTGNYELAFSTLDTWENQSAEQEKAWIWIQKGDILRIFGHLNEALSFFEKAKNFAVISNDKHNTGLSNKRLGDIYTDLGDLNKALAFFKEYNSIEQDLTNSYPNNKEYKHNLAISYSKLGEFYSSLGNLNTSLTFFEELSKLFKELHQSDLENIEFKNGLAVSYSKLGQIQSSLGNLSEALTYFEEQLSLFKELHESHPQNVDFKNGLAISYEKLGQTYSSLGNLDMALAFFEEYNRLEKVLNADYPKNVEFKNNLAISYSNLGELHSRLGQLDKAFEFFKELTKLFKELHIDSPQNVLFKNGLAISYLQLGHFYLNYLKDPKTARQYIQKGYELYEQLMHDFPDHAGFKHNYELAKNQLGL